MPYIGNTIRAADDYRLIDDISSGFNGSDTSFALQVAGSAPVPFPKSPQQVLISVNGVIQEPDPSGSSGFNLVGTNIVFSSAPTNGHAFFGIIYATADYLNSGGNFPSGSLGAPSITFVGDEDTGIYRKGSGSVAFVSNSTEIANTDSNGITISSGNLILGDSGGTSDDRIVLGAGSDLQIFHSGTHSFMENSTGILAIRSDSFQITDKSNNHAMITATADGDVELYHDNSKKFETTSDGVSVRGNLDLPDNTSGNASLRFGNSQDFFMNHNGTDSFIINNTGNLYIRDLNGDVHIQGKDSEEGIIVKADAAVELYYNNGKKFETTSDGATFSGSVLFPDNQRIKIGGDASTPDLQIYHDGSNSRLLESGTGSLILSSNQLQINNAGNTEVQAKFIENGAVELYNNGNKKFETTSYGALLSGNLQVNTVYPSADSSYDIGTNSTRFANGYFDTLYGDGSNLTGVSAGATGGGSDEVFYENSTTVTTSYSITSNKNAMSAGPISINNSVTVTVPSGSVWTIV